MLHATNSNLSSAGLFSLSCRNAHCDSPGTPHNLLSGWWEECPGDTERPCPWDRGSPVGWPSQLWKLFWAAHFRADEWPGGEEAASSWVGVFPRKGVGQLWVPRPVSEQRLMFAEHWPSLGSIHGQWWLPLSASLESLILMSWVPLSVFRGVFFYVFLFF